MIRDCRTPEPAARAGIAGRPTASRQFQRPRFAGKSVYHVVTQTVYHVALDKCPAPTKKREVLAGSAGLLHDKPVGLSSPKRGAVGEADWGV